MTFRITFLKIAPLLVCAATAGCGTFREPQWPKVSPIQVGNSDLTQHDGYYGAAVRAIHARDYGRALDLLQLARQGGEADARTSNALGVVYDKLGRFDLSGRYYAQALALDPSSSVVKANLAYSTQLQQRWPGQSGAPPTELARSAPPAPSVQAQVATAPPQPAATLQPRPVLALIPRPSTAPPARREGSLRLVDASGQPARVDRVRGRLAQLGWSASTVARPGIVAPQTVIRFATSQARVARALARTLPGAAELRECGRGCRGIEVTFGSDVRRWPVPRSKPTSTVSKG